MSITNEQGKHIIANLIFGRKLLDGEDLKPLRQRVEYCDGCDGTGLMEGWNHRDGNSCPKCKGKAVILGEI